MKILKSSFILLSALILTSCYQERVSQQIFPTELVPRVKVDPSQWERIELNASKSYALYHEGHPGKPAILYLHGNAQGADIRSHAQNHLIKHGYHVMIPEYPGYLPADNRIPSEATALSAIKESAARLKALHPNEKIIIIGRSLGGAFGVILASQMNVDGLLTIGAFTKIRDFAPKLPEFVFRENPIDALSAAPKISAPWVIYHCNQDPIVPAYMQSELVKAAQNAPVKSWLKACNFHEMMPEDILTALKWIESH